MEQFYSFVLYSPTFVSLWWSVMLFRESKEKLPARNLLGFFMLASSVVFFSHVIYFSKDYKVYLYIDWFYTLCSLSVYPLFYIYVKMLTSEKGFEKKDFLYLSPALFFSILSGIVYLLMDDAAEYMRLVLTNKNLKNLDFPKIYNIQKNIIVISRMFFFFQILFYMYYGLRDLRTYRKKVSNFYSNVEGRDLKWLRSLTIILALTACVSAVTNFVGREMFLDGSYWVLLPASSFAILLFYIGYLGYKDFFSIKDYILESAESEDKKEISNPLLSHIYEELVPLFENEKVFVRSDLRINEVSLMLQTNRAYVSRAINEICGCSFSDFVNKYRINEAKRLMLFNKTIDEIAEQSGFSSTSSFIRVFKEFENITPGQYQKKVVN